MIHYDLLQMPSQRTYSDLACMVFYRTYRPQSFADLIGQDHIKQALQAALSRDKVAHAYLFCGPRGCGKTTTARILAKALNCHKSDAVQSEEAIKGKKNQTTSLHRSNALPLDPCNVCDSCLAITNGSHMDVIEIDAASNRGIEDIRLLQERITLAPTQGRTKVYIIDEVHMLTTEAFNALLKTLEEPPANTVMILATTEPHKVPQTIQSRCQRLDFALASNEQLIQSLKSIATAEKLEIDDDAYQLLVQRAEGSFRDGTKLLDQIASLNTRITQEIVATYFQTSQTERHAELLAALLEQNSNQALAIITTLNQEGKNISEFLVTFLRFVRLKMLENLNATSGQAKKDRIALVIILKQMALAEKEMRFSSIKSLPIELAILGICEPSDSLVSGDTRSGLKVQSDKVRSDEVKSNPIDQELRTNNQEPYPIAEPEPPAETLARQEIRPEELGAMMAEISDNVVIEAPKEILDIPSEANVEPVKGAKRSNALTVEEIRSHWPALVACIKDRNHSLALLLKNAKIVELNGNILTLEVIYKFHKERLEHEKLRRIAEEALVELVQSPVTITCVLSENRPARDDDPLTYHDDLENAAIDVFGGNDDSGDVGAEIVI